MTAPTCHWPCVSPQQTCTAAPTRWSAGIWRGFAGGPLTVLTVRDDEQAAVRSVFAVSYQALPPRLQRLFRLFGLVPGCDMTAEAVAAMLRCGAGEAADMLSRIADAHLAQERMPGHFGTHDLLGRYVTELATMEDNRESLGDLLSWYLFSVYAAADRLYPQVLRVPAQLPAPAGPPMRFATHVDALAWPTRTDTTSSP